MKKLIFTVEAAFDETDEDFMAELAEMQADIDSGEYAAGMVQDGFATATAKLEIVDL